MVEAGPVTTVRPSRIDLELDQGLVSVPEDDTADYRPLGASTDQRRVAGHPMRTEGGQISRGLDQVRLALTIEPDQGGDPRCQRQLSAWVATKVGDRQVPQVHGGRICQSPARLLP